MDTTFVKSAIDAFKSFVAACGNDVCNNENSEEYVVFSGQITADGKGNIKTYALVNNGHDNDTDEPKRVLVAQLPLRAVLDRGADFAKSMVDLYEARKKEADKKAVEEAEAKAQADEAENREIENKIDSLNTEIETLKASKRPIRRLVKKLSFED